MKNKNLLVELLQKNEKIGIKNSKKKKIIKGINVLLVGILIVALVAFAIVIKPEVEKYIIWLESPLVCIDAGHGGSQSGASAIITNNSNDIINDSTNGDVNDNHNDNTESLRLEKDDNLALALAVRDILEANGVRVIMTRDDDSELTLKKRCEIANSKNAALFISLHRNKADNDAGGIEVWAAKAKDEKETLLATNILENLLVYPYTTNRGVKYGTITGENSDYYVNRYTNMPSVIVETGFITNTKDNELYDQYFLDYATAISKGIIDTIIELFPEEVVIEEK